jgi:hypothetical protein
LNSSRSWDGDYSWEDQDPEEIQAHHLDNGPDFEPEDMDEEDTWYEDVKGCSDCYWAARSGLNHEQCDRCGHDLICVRVDCCHHDLDDSLHFNREDCGCRCAKLAEGVVACSSCNHLSECGYGQIECDVHTLSRSRVIATESLREKLTELKLLRRERSRLDKEYETLRAELATGVMAEDIEILDPENPEKLLARGEWKTSNTFSVAAFKKDNPELYSRYRRERRAYFISFE